MISGLLVLDKTEEPGDRQRDSHFHGGLSLESNTNSNAGDLNATLGMKTKLWIQRQYGCIGDNVSWMLFARPHGDRPHLIVKG